jgi:hypothetical protein
MEKKPQKPVPLGKLPRRSDEVRRALATVTPAREEAAREVWEEFADPEWRELLDARERAD